MLLPPGGENRQLIANTLAMLCLQLDALPQSGQKKTSGQSILRL